MFKRYIKIALKIIVSAVFLFWVIFKVDWLSVLKYLESIKWQYLFLYVVVILVGMIICAKKWKVLADYKEIKLGLFDFFKYYLAGTFINNFMPSFIGGDTFKAYETGKADGRYVEAASSVMMDRITGLFAATILSIIFTLLNLKNVLEDKALVVVNILVFASFAVDIFIMLIRNNRFWSRFKRFFPDKFTAFMIDLGSYSGPGGPIKKTILWGFAFDFVGIALANYILFYALGLHIGLFDYLSVIFIISIIASVPLSINNIGIKEWAYITFFGAFGLDPAAVITVVIISRFVQMLLSFFALPVYLRRNRQ